MKTVHIDYETRSTVDLKKYGAFRYAEDAEILLMAFCVDDGPIYLWDCENRPQQHLHILEKAVRDGWRFYAHNALFEMAISDQCLLLDVGIKPPAHEQWYCTAAMCRRAGLPASLEKAGKALRLPEDLQKDNRGKQLIRKFSLPDSPVYRTHKDDPEGFQAFGEYCRQDVEVERELHRRLARFDLKDNTLPEQTWRADKIINNTGIPVNLKAIDEAIRITGAFEARLTHKFREITGLNPTQRDKVLGWARERGFQEDNLRRTTLERVVPELDPGPLCSAMRIKLQLAYAAVKKLKGMKGCACRDGRVRGTLLYYGAGTGRWAGRLIQPQNFKRPTIPDTPLVLDMLESGQGDYIETLWGNPNEAISSSIRHFLAPGGVHAVDYAAIEARIVCWLAGQEDALEEYRQGIDRYVQMAAIIFGKGTHRITKDERWLGKGTILGAGFGMGHKRFYEQTTSDAETYGIKGVVVTPEICQQSIAAWRKKHSKVVKFWYNCDDAVRLAIRVPGKTVRVQGIKFFVGVDGPSKIRYLHVRLPSGRVLNYPHPSVADGDITYWGQIPGTQRWGRVKLYGGKIVENITQAVAADIMALGTIQALKLGYQVFALIHDEALAEPHGSLEGFIEALKVKPAWAKGLPIEAEGMTCPFYTKT